MKFGSHFRRSDSSKIDKSFVETDYGFYREACKLQRLQKEDNFFVSPETSALDLSRRESVKIQPLGSSIRAR